MSTWLSIGSSPLAVEATERAKTEHKVTHIITCNAGILIEPTPTYYFLSDFQACKLYNAHAREAQRNGTTCVTLKRNDHGLQQRGVEWFDMLQQEGYPYEPFVLSGLWCLEFAAVNCATTVVVAGNDGWSKDPTKPDYFNPAWGHTTHVTNWSEDVIKPRCQLLADKYPNVSWIQYGQPEYTVRAHNWTVIEL